MEQKIKVGDEILIRAKVHAIREDMTEIQELLASIFSANEKKGTRCELK